VFQCVQLSNDIDEDEASSQGQAPAQRAVHVATRRPGKRRAAAAAAQDEDAAGINEELQQRLVMMMTTADVSRYMIIKSLIFGVFLSPVWPICIIVVPI